MSARWKIGVTLAAIVLLSGLVGGTVGFELAKAVARKRGNPTAWGVSAMRTLDWRLKLTPPQKEKVQALIDGGVVELKQTRIETMEKTNRSLDRLTAELAQELTPAQRAEFEKLMKERGQPTIDILKVEPRKKQ